jgi:tRNA(Ile)-lysidine synthase
MSLIKNPEQTVIPKTREFLLNWKIPQHSRIIVSFSGGPDSLALLLSLWSLKEEWALTICSAYINHGLRKKREIQKEINFIKKITNSLGIELVCHHIAFGKLRQDAKSFKRSLEDVAREERYKVLFTILSQKNFDYLALGHTFDDQMETLLMRFFQGSGLAGITGIPAKRGKIIRPLLSCTRREIITFLHEQKKRYIIDSSNQSMLFLRNKIRHKLIPVINDIFPGFKKALQSSLIKNMYAKEFIKAQAETRLKWEKTAKGFNIPGDIFLEAPAIVRLFSLYNVFAKLDIQHSLREKRLPFTFLLPLLRVQEKNSPQTLLRGRGIIIYWKQDRLFLERDVVVPIKKGYFIDVKINTEYTIGGEEKRWKIIFTENSPVKPNFSLLKQKLSFPLVLRSRKEGDKIFFGWGYKKIKKLFNEWKVPIYERTIIPLIEDKQGIVGIIGEPFGCKNCFRKDALITDNLNENVLYCIIQPLELKGEYE